MLWTLKEDELNLISGGANKLGLNQPFQSKVHEGATKQTFGGTDDGPDTSGDMTQNPSGDRPDSIF